MQDFFLHFGSLFCVSTPRKTTLPGVCSPVEAGEVARVAWRRGGDLPRGLRLRLRMTLIMISVLTRKKAGGEIFAARFRDSADIFD